MSKRRRDAFRMAPAILPNSVSTPANRDWAERRREDRSGGKVIGANAGDSASALPTSTDRVRQCPCCGRRNRRCSHCPTLATAIETSSPRRSAPSRSQRQGPSRARGTIRDGGAAEPLTRYPEPLTGFAASGTILTNGSPYTGIVGRRYHRFTYLDPDRRGRGPVGRRRHDLDPRMYARSDGS